MIVWWFALIFAALLPIGVAQRAAAIAGLAVMPLLAISLRKRSLRKGLFSVVSWCVNAAGLIRGLLGRQRNVTDVVDAVEIKTLKQQ